MNAILELREKRAKAWDAAKAFLDARRGDNGIVSAEDEATYNRMEADVINLGKEIERLERQAAIDNELAQATSKPIIGSPTITATSVSGFVLRQGGNYTHGCTAGDDYIMPDSYKCTLAGTSGVLICATFSNTANAVNNESIGILWDGKITFS